MFNSIGILNFYIVNFTFHASSNVLATSKWYCPVLAIYSTQLFYSFQCFSCDSMFRWIWINELINK